jgi:peptidoglycan hydrolase CwlO-like protein
MDDLSEKEKLIASLQQQLREVKQERSALLQEIALLKHEISERKEALKKGVSYK